ncbi:HTH-type transcriptional repressor RspR [Burkholderiales bacterium]|nr:HTH-type transcriptional repressor RspR [Burkholderiales bacterium]
MRAARAPEDSPDAALLPGRRGAAGAACAWLRREILAGRMRPGQTLSENEIAARLGVSRTPVREAIIRLESEGLLSVRPQVGTVVAPIDVEEVADGQFLREAIECRSARLAAGRVRPADVRDLKANLRDQGRAVARHDQARFLALDDRMHRHIVAMAGRPNVWRAVEDVKAQLDRVRVLSLEDPSWLAMILAQHEAIVHDVLAGDGDAAAKTMEAHLRSVFASIDTIAAREPDYFRGAPVASRSGAPPVRQRSSTTPAGRNP